MLRDSRHDRVAPASGAASRDDGELIGGRYRVERALGSGGMAHVLEVCDLRSDRRLALKRLARKESRRSLALFEREYCTLSSLHHPNIVEVHEYAADERGPYCGAPTYRTLAPRPWSEVCSLTSTMT